MHTALISGSLSPGATSMASLFKKSNRSIAISTAGRSRLSSTCRSSYGALPFGTVSTILETNQEETGRAKRHLRRRSVQAETFARRIIFGDRKFRQHVFRNVYQRNLWGNDGHSKYFSGTGSRGAAAKMYVEEMGQLLANHASRLDRPLIVVDLGCGDFQIGAALIDQLPNIVYVGCDIVPELIAEHKRIYASDVPAFGTSILFLTRFQKEMCT